MTVPIERAIRSAIARHQLDRIEIVSADGRRFTAVAYPAAWSKIVQDRRMAAFAAAGKTEFSMAEANAISKKAVGDSLCRATADTIGEAVTALGRELAVAPAIPEDRK